MFADYSKKLIFLTKPDLQLDTDYFTEGADENGMEYKIDKRKSINFEKKLASSDALLSISNVSPTVDSIKDLGIIISSNIIRDNLTQKK